jgi:hypothetical protein
MLIKIAKVLNESDVLKFMAKLEGKANVSCAAKDR